MLVNDLVQCMACSTNLIKATIIFNKKETVPIGCVSPQEKRKNLPQEKRKNLPIYKSSKCYWHNFFKYSIGKTNNLPIHINLYMFKHFGYIILYC